MKRRAACLMVVVMVIVMIVMVIAYKTRNHSDKTTREINRLLADFA